jgi:hypothetical protein
MADIGGDPPGDKPGAGVFHDIGYYLTKRKR